MTRILPLALATAFVAACSGEPITADATATPTTLLLGDPAVVLTGTVGPAGETLAVKWTVAKKPDGSTAAVVDDTKETASFTPDKAGSYEIAFTVSDPDLRTGGGIASMLDSRASASKSVTLEVAAADATKLVFRTQPTDIVAGAAFAPAIAVELRNVRDEVVVTNQEVTLLFAEAAEPSFIGSSTVAAVDGVATFTGLSVGLAGTGYMLDATASGLPNTRSDAFDVVAGAPDKGQSSISCAPETVVAGSAVTCTVHVNDMYGNPISGVDATVTSSGTNTTVEPSGAVATGPNGEATVTVTPGATGTEIITATVDGWPVETTIEVTPGAADATQSTLVVSPPTAVANGSSTVLVVVHARDAQGNAVPGVEVTTTASGSANEITPAVPQLTDASGAAAFSLVSTKAEEKTITAALGGFTLTGAATFVAGPISLDVSTMTVLPESAVVGGEEKLTVTLTLGDAFGNPVAGEQVTFGSEAREDEFSTTDPVATDENGVATVDVTSTLAGTRPASAMFADEQKLTADMVFTAGTPDPRTSTIEIRPSKVLADGRAEAAIRVVLRDSYGNPVPDTEVGLSLAGGLRDVPVPASGRTDGNGRFDAVLTSLKAGLKEVVAGWGGASTISATVTFMPGEPDKSQSSIAASPTSLVADGVAKTTLTATIRDTNGNPVPSALVTFDLSGTGNTLGATEATTDANGQASVEASSVDAEAKTARALIPLAWDVSTAVTFVPGPPEVRHCTFTATPAALAANNTDTSALSLTVRDAQDNVVPGLAVTFTATGTGNTLTPTSGTTSASGTVTSSIKSSVAETKSVTAAFAGKTMNQTIIFAAGVADPSKSTLVATPTSVVANGTSTTTLTLTLKDATNNPIANQAVVFNSTGTANGFSVNGPTNASGVTTVTMNSTKAEAKTITASFAGGAKSVNVTFIAGPPVLAKSTFAGAPATVVANNSATSTLTATLRDANSNPCSGIAVNVAVTGKGNKLNGAAPPAPPAVAAVSVTTNTSGIATVTVASDKAETKIATATFGTPTQTFPTVSLNFVPGPADAARSDFTASPTTLVADNVTTSTFNLVVRDAFGNVIPNLAVTVPLMTRGSTVMTVGGNTNASGVFGGAVKSNIDGTHTLYANFGTPAQQKQLTLEFTPAPPEIIELTTPATMSSCATITYKIKQLQSKPVDVAFHYSRDLGLRGRAMTRHTTLPDGLTGLASSPAGTAHTFVWNTTTDVPREDLSTVIITATPSIPAVVTGSSVQVVGQVVQNALRFGTPATVAAGTQPHGLASADFNLDGRPDLVVVLQGLNKVAVHLNNGSGGFGAGTQYGTGTTPYNVAVADLNRDGKPDFAVGNQGSQSVSTYINTGTGTFTGPNNHATGGSPIALAIGDVSRDGIPDIVTANNVGTAYVSVLIGTGSSFAPYVGLATTNGNTTSIALADADGDGDLDIYAGVYAPNNVEILRNTGTGTFSGVWGAPTTGTVPRSLAVADFTQDGKPDVLVANQASSNLSFLPNTGVANPLPYPPTMLTAGAGPFVLSPGDFDNDGLVDAAVAASGAAAANILLGTGSGFEAARLAATTGGSPYGLVSADFNADGRLDVATANWNGGNMTVALNTTAYRCDPGFGPAVVYSAPVARTSIAQADLDNDGNLDLVTGDVTGLGILYGLADGTFEPAELAKIMMSRIDYPITAVATGDVNRDGKIDIVLTSDNATTHARKVVVVPNNGARSLGALVSYAASPDTMLPYSVRLDDMNRDGFLDILVARNAVTNPNTTQVNFGLLTGGASGFAAVVNGGAHYGNRPQLTTVDWSLDGIVDYASGGHFGALGRATAANTYATSFTSASLPNDIAHGDFNRDGWPDIVMSADNTGTNVRAMLFLNNKAGGLTQTNLAGAALPTALAVHDVDGDGIPDLLQPATNGTLVASFLNGSNGVRQTSTFATGTSTPGDLLVGDYNKDGKVDAVVADPDGGVLRVMLGR